MKFGHSSVELLVAWFDGTHYIRVRQSAATQFNLIFNDGGGNHSTTWNHGGAVVADTEYLVETKYNASQMEVLFDGVQRMLIVTPINFANIPNTAYWGIYPGVLNHIDAVFIAP
jgi:hypothetical protein